MRVRKVGNQLVHEKSTVVINVLCPFPAQSDIVYTFMHCLLRDEQDLAKLEEGEEWSP